MTEPSSSDAPENSMEAILASIRRIIREDEASGAPEGGAESARDEDDVLVLDASMMVPNELRLPEPEISPAHEDPARAVPVLPPEPVMQPQDTASVHAPALAEPLRAAEPAPPPVLVVPHPVMVQEAAELAEVPPVPSTSPEPLLAPERLAAAVQSLAALEDAVKPEAPPTIPLLRSGGPSLEDLVRDELRGQLKLWLDENLPPLVERLVRQEIERVVRRQG